MYCDPFFKILSIQKIQSFQMKCFASLQTKGLQNYQLSKFEFCKKWRTPGVLESDLLNKISLQQKMSDFFFKSQTLTPGSFAALCSSRMHSTSFERSIFFLMNKILKKCFAAVLRGFMVAQSYPILLHKMAFQPFWVPITVSLIQ